MPFTVRRIQEDQNILFGGGYCLESWLGSGAMPQVGSRGNAPGQEVRK